MSLGHRVLAAWYTQLAQQLEAGLTLREAVATSGMNGALRRLGAAMAARIDAGGSADDALRLADGALPQADVLTLSAAADAGRLPQVLHSLSGRHARLAAAKFRIVLACAYPMAIVHLGAILLPITRRIDWEKGLQWDTLAYLRDVAVLLVPLWLALAVLFVLAKRQSPVLRAIAAKLPGTGAYLRAQSLADLCFALGNFLSAGVPIGDAWAAVGLITRSPQLALAAESLQAEVSRGEAPGAHLHAWPCFPSEFIAQYRSGEKTGTLDSTLIRLSEQYQETANRSLTVVTLLYPALLFLGVAGAVVYAVLTFYAGYLKMLTKLAE